MRSVLEARIRIVQSSTNRWVKALRFALARPPALAHASPAPPLLALEGFHLLVEALRSGMTPVAIFLRAGEESESLRVLEAALVADKKFPRATLPPETELIVLPAALFASATQTEAPQPIAALVPAPLSTPMSIAAGPSPLVLVLASLQDSGNVGTLLRSAEAFGATGALLLSGTATPWSSKCLRASAGSAFRLPVLAMGSAAEAAALLRAHAICSFAAVPHGKTPVDEASLHKPAALWIGNEGAGLRPAELAACDARITLPMPGETESLNAAVAGSLLLYEASRQRMSRAVKPV